MDAAVPAAAGDSAAMTRGRQRRLSQAGAKCRRRCRHGRCGTERETLRGHDQWQWRCGLQQPSGAERHRRCQHPCIQLDRPQHGVNFRRRSPLGAGSATELSITTQPSASAQNAIAFGAAAGHPAPGRGQQPGEPAQRTDHRDDRPGGGALTGSTTTVNTNASGLATFTNLRITDQVGNHTLSFTSGSLDGGYLGNSSISTAGNATTIAASAGDGQSATAGTAVPIDPEVWSLDVSGNPVQGESVTVSRWPSGGGTVVPTSAILTDASGNAAATRLGLLAPLAGPNTLTATSAGLNGSPLTFDATGNGRRGDEIDYHHPAVGQRRRTRLSLANSRRFSLGTGPTTR